MGMLDRYKKKGGFVQILNLVETSSSQKQEQFLALIKAENPAWDEAIRQRMLSLQKIFSWDHDILIEIYSRTHTLTVAAAIFDFTPEHLEQVLSCLQPLQKRKITDKMSEIKPTPGERLSSQMKLISEVRGMIQQGLIKIDKMDPLLIIPENIDDLLSQKPSVKNHHTENSTKDALDKIKNLEKSLHVEQGYTAETSAHNVSSLEIKKELLQYQKLIEELQSEIQYLRTENDSLNERLSQIRKIA